MGNPSPSKASAGVPGVRAPLGAHENSPALAAVLNAFRAFLFQHSGNSFSPFHRRVGDAEFMSPIQAPHLK